VSAPTPNPLVTVVIPAFNAQATIAETLLSARRQTYTQLEIIVVDDGSTDATRDLVLKQANEDPRVRLIRQANAGVAAARTAGAAPAAGEFFAPLDADDTWMPDKIERQLEPFMDGDPEIGVVYAWSQTIDDDACVIDEPRPESSGWVLPDMALRNFIGNGSSPLIRMSAFRETAGYDSTLKHRGGQGCEDRKLYLELAARWRFALVPEFLTLYRLGSGNMSSDVKQMLRSHDLVSADVLAEHPELAPIFHQSRNRLARYMLRRASRERRFGALATLIIAMAAHDPAFARQTIRTLSKGAVQRRLGRLRPGGEAGAQD
jgi:glycosyltransferase involved in cell wall biosynthesis